MKTIYTTLPIYDKLAKQLYERSKHAGMDKPLPIVCPRHRLPSFQWKDDGDGVADGMWIDLISDQYDGSEESLVSTWTVYAGTYHTFNSSGLNITQLKMVGAGDGVNIKSENFDVEIGDIIHVRGVAAGALALYPYVIINTDPIFWVNQVIHNGVNDIEMRSRVAGNVRIEIAALGVMDFSFTGVTITRIKNIRDLNYIMPAAPFHYWIEKDNDYFSYKGDTLNELLDPGLYYLRIHTGLIWTPYYYSEWFKVDCVFGSDAGLPPTLTYSTKYLIINFSNSCNLGSIYYEGGFTQTLYLESEPMEATFPQEEEGAKNGEGQFVRTFARQVKKYLVRTGTLPDYMVDVFNRMKLHDTVELTDLVGDVNDVYNLEVEHEWLNTDKYYAKIELTFDYNEVAIVSSCCESVIIAGGSTTADSGTTTADSGTTVDGG